MGDVLFIVARVARMLKIDAEEALRAANHKFKRRFRQMEEIIRSEQREFNTYTIEEWMDLWEKAKIS